MGFLFACQAGIIVSEFMKRRNRFGRRYLGKPDMSLSSHHRLLLSKGYNSPVMQPFMQLAQVVSMAPMRFQLERYHMTKSSQHI